MMGKPSYKVLLFIKKNRLDRVFYLGLLLLLILPYQNCADSTNNLGKSLSSSSRGTTPSPTPPVSPVPPTPPIGSGEEIPNDAIWVATTGNDSTGDGTSAKPYKTISRGLRKLNDVVGPGGTVVVKPGTYVGELNFINQSGTGCGGVCGDFAIPSGTSAKHTTIRAEIPLTVRIENTASGDNLTYYESPLLILGSYIRVDGFVFAMHNLSSSYIGNIYGNHNKITRTHFKRSGTVDEYGGWLGVPGSNNLIEDVAGVGVARYGIYSGGGQTEATCVKNIFRRIVARVDYVVSSQPKAAFAIYGGNNTDNTNSHLVQNLIVVDSQSGNLGIDQYGQNWGGLYLPHRVANIKIQGSIVLNHESHRSGFYSGDNYASSGVQLLNSVAWDVKPVPGSGSSWQQPAGVVMASSGGANLWNKLTIGQKDFSTSLYGFSVNTQSPGPNNNFTESLILNLQNIYNNPGNFISRTYNTIASPALKYIVDSGTNIYGAKILYKYGVTGSVWGDNIAPDPAALNETAESLWPYPYEDEIKKLFAESNTPPAGAQPTTNNTKRGFTVDNDQFGKPQTLTRYIWQYLSSPCPAGICN